MDLLQLEAWSLKLDASYALREAQHNILGDDTLMFTVYNTLRVAVPALPAI